MTNWAGIMTFGVALFPTTPDKASDKLYTLLPYSAEWLGWLHYGFAALLILIFAVLAINVFTIGQEKNEDIPISLLNENNIYRLCGYSIIGFIVMIPISMEMKLFEYSTLLFEALSLFSFGLAWLIKGRALGDKGKIGEVLYREENAKASDVKSNHVVTA